MKILSFPTELRDDFWFKTGGIFENELRDLSNTQLLLDFSDVVWADPIPLLSLICLSAEFRARGGILRIELGFPNNQNGQFSVFIARHGFLSLLAKDSIVSWSGRDFQYGEYEMLEESLRSLTGALTYQDAECIPATVFDPSALDAGGVAKLVEELVDLAHPRINSWLPGNSRRRGLMAHQLRVFLGETLDNVREHAFRERIGYGSLYARIRIGRPEEARAFRSWSKAKLAEQVHCPTLNRCLTGRRPGWLELFVADTGVGISFDLTDQKSPLKQLSTKFFVDPISRLEKDLRAASSKTSMTGLQRIGQLLVAGQDQKSRGDFARLYCNGECVGDHLPWSKRSKQPAYLNVQRLSAGATPPAGTVLHFSLEPPPANAREQAELYPPSFYQPNQDDLHNVREELQRRVSEPAGDFLFFDVYRTERQRFAAPMKALSDAEHKKVVIIRPSRSLGKWDLIELVGSFLADNSNTEDLILADIPWSSAIDFHNIISSQRTWFDASKRSRLKVHLVSQDWFCSSFVFSTRYRKFTFKKGSAQAFLSSHRNEASAALVASVLRVQDSKLFWARVGKSYINEPIEWSDSSQESLYEIWGYLDLHLALSELKLNEIVRRSVRRAVSSFTPQAVYSSDDISRRVLQGSDFNLEDFSSEGRRLAEDSVLVGSVSVSGGTVRRFARFNTISFGGVLQIFQHPGLDAASRSSLLALDWLPPPRAPIKERRRFSRVENTPFVIRGGASAVPLPRFSTPETESAPQYSLYGESPAAAYQAWQHRSLLRLGHWHYGSKHDLLTLRLEDALAFDTFEGGIMVDWFAKQIEEWIPAVGGTRKGFVVYAQHQVSSILARELSQLPAFENLDFFPAAAADSGDNATLALSPITRESVIAVCRERLKDGGVAIIIDDAIISGQTTRRIQQTVDGLWEQLRRFEVVTNGSELAIKTLAIVDRSSEPAQRALVEKNLINHRRFWRWDVPTLGHHSACPLCSLLGRWRALSSSIHGSVLNERLNQWLHQWSVVPVQEGRFSAGVPMRRLSPSRETRFGIVEGQEPHVVEHSLAVSFVSVATEISRATTQKDFPLVKANEAWSDSDEADSETAFELLSTQILLTGGTLSKSELLDRLRLILELLWATSEVSISSALASMVMIQDQDLVDELWVLCTELVENEGFPNEDALLVALALYNLAEDPDSSGPRKGSPWDLFELCRLPSNEGKQAIIMVLRVFGWSPNSVHRASLVDRLSPGDGGVANISNVDLDQAILMLERLGDALIDLPLSSLESTSLEPQSDGERVREIASELKKVRASWTANERPAEDLLRSAIESAYNLLFSPNGLHRQYRDRLCVKLVGQDGVNQVLIPAWRLISNRWSAFVSEKGEEMAQRWNEPPIVIWEDSKGPERPVYLLFDNNIRNAVADLMSNVVHSTDVFTCPWPDQTMSVEAHLWGRLRMNDDGLSAEIELVNRYDGEDEIRPRITSSLAHLSMMGGSFRVSHDVERLTVTTTVTVPTAARITAQ